METDFCSDIIAHIFEKEKNYFHKIGSCRLYYSRGDGNGTDG